MQSHYLACLLRYSFLPTQPIILSRRMYRFFLAQRKSCNQKINLAYPREVAHKLLSQYRNLYPYVTSYHVEVSPSDMASLQGPQSRTLSRSPPMLDTAAGYYTLLYYLPHFVNVVYCALYYYDCTILAFSKS